PRRVRGSVERVVAKGSFRVWQKEKPVSAETAAELLKQSRQAVLIYDDGLEDSDRSKLLGLFRPEVIVVGETPVHGFSAPGRAIPARGTPPTVVPPATGTYLPNSAPVPATSGPIPTIGPPAGLLPPNVPSVTPQPRGPSDYVPLPPSR